jgi:CMP-N,N'-diacetyllegionaminic acid synthase
MTTNLKILAIIPARGGSKGLPGKNIRILNGKPLIAYSIEEAKKSKYIDRVILSTDSQEIIDACKPYDIEVPFIRPIELATDNALAVDNYEYTLNRMKDEFNYDADVLVVLQPTSPLRTVEDIDKAIEIYINKKGDSVVSVCELPHPIERVRKLTEDGKIRNYSDKKIVLKNRQDYEKLFVPNGVVFVLNVDLFLKHKTYYFDNTYAYIMSKKQSIDVDDILDFSLIELIIKQGL